MSVRFGVLCALAALVGGCAPPRGQQLCDAIAKRDLKAVEDLLSGPAISMVNPQGTCVPAAAVFGVARPDDKALTSIGVALVAAGLPADASWLAPGSREPVRAIDAAVSNGNTELVRALIAVGLDVTSPDATRALVQAAGDGQLRIVQLLVQEGADLEATSGGDTALDRARDKGRDDVVRFLEATAAARPQAAAKPQPPHEPQEP